MGRGGGFCYPWADSTETGFPLTLTLMAYLDGYEHDVFITYALSDDRRGWVTAFHQRLTQDLGSRLGHAAVRLASPDHRPDTMAADRSAVLVVVTSARLSASDECQREIQAFQSALERRGDASAEPCRTVPVLIRKLQPEHWPEPCRRAGEVLFCRTDLGLGYPLEPDGADFARAMQTLTDRLSELLHAIRADRGQRPQSGEDDQARLLRVFLAVATDDLDGERRSIADEALQLGVDLMPDLPSVLSQQEHSDRVTAAIRSADLCVHLLGPLPGRSAFGPMGLSYPLEQLRLSLDNARSLLVLYSEELIRQDVEEAGYRQLLSRLERDPRSPEHLERIPTRPRRMAAEVVKKVRQLQVRTPPPTTAGPRTAVLDLTSRDLEAARELQGYLMDKGLRVITSSADQVLTAHGPEAGMEAFEEDLRQAQIFIVVYGEFTRRRVVARLTKAFELALLRGLGARRSVYLPPTAVERPDEDFDDVYVIDHRRGFNPETIDRILRQL